MDVSGAVQRAVVPRLPGPLRRLVEAPVVRPRAREAVARALAPEGLDPGTGLEEATRAEALVHAELVTWPRLWRAAVTLVGTVVSGVFLGAVVGSAAEEPAMPAAGVVTLGVVALVAAVLLVLFGVWGLVVVRDGRRLKQAFVRWQACADRLRQQAEPPVVAPTFSGGRLHVGLMGLLLAAAPVSWLLVASLLLDSSAGIGDDVGIALAVGVPAWALTVAAYAVWRTPASMIVRMPWRGTA